MEDPLEGIAMPYSASFFPRPGFNTMHITPEHQASSTYRLNLPSGVSAVTVSTNDWYGLRLWHEQPGKENVLAAEIPRRERGGGELPRRSTSQPKTQGRNSTSNASRVRRKRMPRPVFWQESPSFLSAHTNHPGGGLDDHTHRSFGRDLVAIQCADVPDTRVLRFDDPGGIPQQQFLPDHPNPRWGQSDQADLERDRVASIPGRPHCEWSDGRRPLESTDRLNNRNYPAVCTTNRGGINSSGDLVGAVRDPRFTGDRRRGVLGWSDDHSHRRANHLTLAVVA